MKVKLTVEPLLSYGPPQYPVKEQALAHPELLASTPTRWKGSPILCAALALMVSAGMSGCMGQGGKVRLFERGEGRVYGDGWVGMVAPAAFLSEQEACQIIFEEAEARGLHFEMKGEKELIGDFPIPNSRPDTFYYTGEKPETWHGALILDGYHAGQNVGFEYISKEDIENWSQAKLFEGELLSFYRFHDTGENLAESLRKQMDEDWGRIGILYDPGTIAVQPNGETLSDAAYQALQKQYKIEKLRLQVRDFLDWLAAEGII